jgi:hypothetical protein
MRRLAMAGAVLTVGTMLGVLAPVGGGTAAWAGGPQHVKTTVTFDDTFPAGTFCDFALRNVGTVSDNVVTTPNNTIDHVLLNATHINLATGFTLTETDSFTDVTATGGQTREVGIFWHLRNTDGKIVLVQAGQIVLSAEGEVLKFTPNINPDSAAVICPALGGQPAP